MNELSPAASVSDLGALPQWNLTRSLSEHRAHRRWRADLASGRRRRPRPSGGAGRASWRQRRGAELGEAVAAYEALQDLLGRIGSYAQLVYAGNMTDPAIARFYQTIQERVTDIAAELLFFTLELNKLEDADLADEAEGAGAGALPALAAIPCAPSAPHQLSDEVERCCTTNRSSAAPPGIRLFDETMARLRFPFDGKALTIERALNLLTDRDGAKRKTAAKALATGLRERAARPSR